MNQPVGKRRFDSETLQGYACLLIAAALGLTVLLIVVLSLVHWLG